MVEEPRGGRKERVIRSRRTPSIISNSGDNGLVGDGWQTRREALPLRLKRLSDKPSPLGGGGLETIIVITI